MDDTTNIPLIQEFSFYRALSSGDQQVSKDADFPFIIMDWGKDQSPWIIYWLVPHEAAVSVI